MSQETPTIDNTLLVGQIVSSFGLKGQLKVRSYTDHVEHLRRRVKTVYLGPKRQAYQLRGVFEHKPGLLIITLAGVTDRDAAEELRGLEVAIRERDAAPLDEDEYFIHQLYGLIVETEDGATLGKVREVLETGANEVLVVARPDQPEALIPMIRDVVQLLDIPNNRVVIRLLDGLIP
jgi:16S rRNA processing protein RimM